MQCALPPFKTCSPLRLIPVENGGWVVQEDDHPGRTPRYLGAFSSASDMMGALANALIPLVGEDSKAEASNG